MHPQARRLTFLFSTAVALAITAGVVVTLAPAPVAAATTGAGFHGITPYGGFLGNYIAPDGTRVYCIDADRDWPSGITDGGVVVDSLATGWGAPLAADTLQKFNYALSLYGQTGDPVQAAAVSAYLYAYTSGLARQRGPGYEVGLHYIDGNALVAGAYSTIWDDVEAHFAASLAPTADVTIDMTEPLSGEVVVTTTPEGAAGTLTLEGAVVAESSSSSIPVVGGDRIAITGSPSTDAISYTIAASASFQTQSGYLPLITVYTTGAQQRTIRDAGPAQIDFESSARVEVTLPSPPEPEVPTLAATGAPLVWMLGAALALFAAGALAAVVHRSREYRQVTRVDLWCE